MENIIGTPKVTESVLVYYKVYSRRGFEVKITEERFKEAVKNNNTLKYPNNRETFRFIRAIKYEVKQIVTSTEIDVSQNFEKKL